MLKNKKCSSLLKSRYDGWSIREAWRFTYKVRHHVAGDTYSTSPNEPRPRQSPSLAVSDGF